MSKPILDQDFWRGRLAGAEQRWQALFHCTPETWYAIAARHRATLARHIGPRESILDAGCAYGRLLNLLPASWAGGYLGIDLMPEFIELAKQEHAGWRFQVGELLAALPTLGEQFDWAVCISMRPMITGNLGEAYWEAIQAQLLRVAPRLLLLEYDANDQGQVIERDQVTA